MMGGRIALQETLDHCRSNPAGIKYQSLSGMGFGFQAIMVFVTQRPRISFWAIAGMLMGGLRSAHRIVYNPEGWWRLR